MSTKERKQLLSILEDMLKDAETLVHSICIEIGDTPDDPFINQQLTVAIQQYQSVMNKMRSLRTALIG